MRKEQKADNKVCQYCGKTLVQKSNRDCHVRNQHEDGTFKNTDANEAIYQSVVPLTFVPEFEPFNQPGTSNQQSNAEADIDSIPYRNIIDATMAEMEQETYEVFEPSFNIFLSPVRDDNAELTESASLLHTNLEIGEELIRMAIVSTWVLIAPSKPQPSNFFCPPRY